MTNTKKRVRAGQVFTFRPVGMDVWRPAHQGLEPGELVKVVKLPGCPAPGVMGHCHVARVSDGKFAGLVLVNSLVKEGK